ncbi:MAG: hypothetical protein ACLFTR_03400 [Candidatus Woesearchaeota archaeon]
MTQKKKKWEKILDELNIAMEFLIAVVNFVLLLGTIGTNIVIFSAAHTLSGFNNPVILLLIVGNFLVFITITGIYMAYLDNIKKRREGSDDTSPL